MAEITQGSRRTAVTAAILVAGVYAYFLLFSQFAFLEIVQGVGLGELRIKVILGVMALGGILGAYRAQRIKTMSGLRHGLLGCALAAGVPIFLRDLWSLGLTSMFMGLSLGFVTVCLAAQLPYWLTRERGCLYVGIGTGLGYAICNFPVLFLATPLQQCRFSALIALAAFVVSWLVKDDLHEEKERGMAIGKHHHGMIVLVFLAFVWMDSGAFYVIQHAPDLKKATWGAEKLWINAALHLLAAVAAGWLLARGQFRLLLVAAALVLGLAAMWVNDASTLVVAGYFYPVAVSFYSTALVCWPGLIEGKVGSWKRAAWVFAIAGWIGSGLGIGMVENLHRVPVWFVIVAWIVIFAGLFGTGKKSLLFLLVGVMIHFLLGNVSSPVSELTAVERGRRTFVAEGCLHCHSQYLRPASVDEGMWGKAIDTKEVLSGEPVLIGNRRQGPDLSRIPGRRSPAWLRLHFLEPRSLVPDSTMPSYAHLFADGRGDDLMAYLTCHAERDIPLVQEMAQRWTDQAANTGNKELGRMLYQEHCAGCHGMDGKGDGILAQRLNRPPANLAEGPWMWSAQREGESASISIERLVRFGIPGTDMPGHETWTSEQCQSVAAYLLEWRK
ncbi:MAG: cbb3-type cytochrome c oxidase subunit II [Akkermansiaceae bacterium]